MVTKIKDSSNWTPERARGPGKPFITFKLVDPSFVGVKAAHVYRQENHWNWVWWDLAGNDHRPSSAGFATPERAAVHMLVQLTQDSITIMERRAKILEAT
jgi:hypothetical protein